MESLRARYDRLRSSLWLLPLLSVIAALLLADWLRGLDGTVPPLLQGLLFTGEPESAQAILQLVAGAIITVTSLVFSLTVLTIQVAASQASPRLQRSFLQDRGNQVVLSIFLSTFVYCVTVLRSVDDAGVPELAVSVALLFTLASVAALVYVIHHIAHSIRLDVTMWRVEAAAIAAIERNHPEHIAGAEWHPPRPCRRSTTSRW